MRGGWINWPGDPDAEHEFVFIEDAGKAMVDLARRDAAYGQAIHLPGRVTTARGWLTQIFRIAGTPLYLFEEPVILDGTKYRTMFGDYPSTSFEEGIRKTLVWFRV